MLLYKCGLNKSLTVCKNDGFTFAANTTYGLGGKAFAAYFPENIVQATKAFDICAKQGKGTFVLGNGSDVLASDSGFDGNVISTKRLRGIIGLSGNRIFCLAGTRISDLLKYCAERGLGGLEFLYGIPATVGGAAYMNAGISDYSIGAHIEKVLVYDGKKRYFDQKSCNFTYRHSTMRDINCLILAVVIRLEAVSIVEIEARTDFFRQKRMRLPKGRSCGCVFKNPEGYFAGALIERANLKGVAIGSASVSPEHANFIINNGRSSADVKALIDLVKRTVKEKFGITLYEEVVYIGDFDGTDS